jgi:uncharacterized protein (DUF1800 family)
MKLKKARIFSAVLAASMLLNSTGMTVLAESNNEGIEAGLETETSADEPADNDSEPEEGAAESDAANVAQTVVETEEAAVESSAVTEADHRSSRDRGTAGN